MGSYSMKSKLVKCRSNIYVPTVSKNIVLKPKDSVKYTYVTIGLKTNNKLNNIIDNNIENNNNFEKKRSIQISV